MKTTYKLFILYSTFAILMFIYVICVKKNIFKEAFTDTIVRINTLSRMNPTYRPSLTQSYNNGSFKKLNMTTRDLIATGGLGPQYTLSALTGEVETTNNYLASLIRPSSSQKSCPQGRLYSGMGEVILGESECTKGKYCSGCSNATFYKNTRRDTGFCKCL